MRHRTNCYWAACVALLSALSCTAVSHAQTGSGAEPYGGEAPVSAEEHAKRALVAFNLQDWAAAQREYEAAYKLEQKPEYLWGLAQAQRLGGQHDGAIKTYKAYQRSGVSASQANAAEMMVLKSEAEVAKLELKKAKEQAAQSNAAAAPAPGAQPPPPTPDPGADASSASSGGLHVGWFIAGTVVTVGLGAVSIWSGIDTQNKASDYEDAPTLGAYEDGTGLETRTNVLFVATAIAATATVVIAIFTDWSGEPDEEETGWQLAPSVGRDGGALLLTSQF